MNDNNGQFPNNNMEGANNTPNGNAEPNFNSVFNVPPAENSAPAAPVMPAQTAPDTNAQAMPVPEVPSPVMPAQSESPMPVGDAQAAPVMPAGQTSMTPPNMPDMSNQEMPVPQGNMMNVQAEQPAPIPGAMEAQASVPNMPEQNMMQPNNQMVDPMNQNPDPGVAPTSAVDEELLKSFIGKNFEKFFKSFNFAGFFLTGTYMLYRKMFAYAILLFILEILIALLIPKLLFLSIGINLLCGLFVNKLYLSFASKKIAKIKNDNSNSSQEDLKALCTRKGGTSIGYIFLGGFAETIIIVIAMFAAAALGISTMFGGLMTLGSIQIPGANKPLSTTGTEGTVIQNASINGYACFGNNCTIYISSNGSEDEEYLVSADYSDLFSALGYYKEYLNVDIYYSESGGNKTIVGYKTTLKSTGEDISDATTEEAIRAKVENNQ